MRVAAVVARLRCSAQRTTDDRACCQTADDRTGIVVVVVMVVAAAVVAVVVVAPVVAVPPMADLAAVADLLHIRGHAGRCDVGPLDCHDREGLSGGDACKTGYKRDEYDCELFHDFSPFACKVLRRG